MSFPKFIESDLKEKNIIKQNLQKRSLSEAKLR